MAVARIMTLTQAVFGSGFPVIGIDNGIYRRYVEQSMAD
jgi:hypothetical protein